MQATTTPNLPDPVLAARSAEQHRVLLDSQLRELGVTRAQVRAHVAAGRWVRLGTRSVATDLGPLTGPSAWARAVAETGPMAALAGTTALAAAGMTGYTDADVHVWTPKSSRPGRPPQVVVHESRRWSEEDVVTVGVRRMRPAVAAVQAALWALTPRQASLLLVMPVQQRLVTVGDVGEALGRVRRHRFRTVLQDVVRDVADGAQSLGELDFAAHCRARGLPEPARQVVRRTSQGRIYLDVYWAEFRVVVEVNGVGHEQPAQRMRDELRAIEAQVRRDAVVTVSLLTLRLDPDPFFRQLARLLRARGWTP